MGNLIQYVVGVHQSGDALTILRFYTALAGFVLILLLLVRHGRGLSTAVRANKRAEEASQDAAELHALLDRIEQTMSRDLKQLLADRMDQRLAMIESAQHEGDTHCEQTIRARADELSEEISALADEHGETRTRQQALDDRLGEMERFKAELVSRYQDHVQGVVGSFQGAVDTVVAQLKKDMSQGLGEPDRAAQPEQAGTEGGEEPPSPPPEAEDETEDWLAGGGDLLAGDDQDDEPPFTLESGGPLTGPDV